MQRFSQQTNRQVKLQVLKDEMLAARTEKSNSGNSNARSENKKNKCGQCEKNLAFTVSRLCFTYFIDLRLVYLISIVI
jgi:hypothetical protein